MFQEPVTCKSEPGSAPEQHPAAKVGSLCNSKEAEQPSPVSILEAPFCDDVSSGSECFESLSADLQGDQRSHFSNSSLSYALYISRHNI